MLAAGSYRNKRKRARERIQQYRTVVNDKINQENGSILLHSLLEDHGNICHQHNQRTNQSNGDELITSDEILMDIESDGAVVDVSDITAFSNGSRRRSCRIRVPSQRLSESRENDITQRERRRHNRERLLNSRIASAQQRLLRTDNGGAVLLNATNLRLKEANNFINSDAKKYARALETLSRFVLCGICGTEDSCKMMFSMAKATQLIKECLPLKNAYKKLSREKSEFAKCVKQDFTKYGILVNAEHLCKYCFNKLRCNSKSMNSSKSVHSFMIEDETDESDDDDDFDDDDFSEIDEVSEDNASNCGGGNCNETDDSDLSDDGNILNEDACSEAYASDNENVEVKNTVLNQKSMNPRALILGLYTGQVPIELLSLTKIEKSMISLINIVQHFVSDVVAEASGYGKSYSKVYALLNNVTNIANQLPNMAALDGTAYIKTKSTGVNKSYTYRPNRVKRALDWLKINNQLYRDVKIEYPTDWNLNCHIDVEIPVNSSDMSPEFEADVREAVDDINTNIGCNPCVENDVSMEIEFLVQDDPSVVGDDELFRKVNEPSILYREKYSKELLVRRYKTEDFNYLAFPWLYPYGRGYDSKITDVKYARLVLQHGYDRRFQGADDFIFLYYYEIMNKKTSWIASLVNNIHLNGELNSNNNETNTTASSDNNDVADNSALPAQNVNSSDSTLPVIRVSEMKSFLDNINSVEGFSQLQIEKLTKLLRPFAADVPGTSMHISLMRRRILSLITNPIVREHGVFTWFNTVTPSDFYCPLLFTNLVKKTTMSWKESETAVHNLNLKDRKTLLRQHPALFCRLFEIKQRLINEHILDGDNAPMGKRRDYFIRAEFQGRGCVHYHIMISISHNDVDEHDVYSDNPEVGKKVKDFVGSRLTSMLLKRDVHHDQTHARNTTTGLIDDSILEVEDSFQYHPKPVELFQHPLCNNDDPRRLPFNDALNYERNQDGRYIDPRVGKQYRNLQLSSFMHYCCQSCWKYNKGYDRCCRHMYPYEAAKLNTTIETTKNKRNNRQRTRVLPPRNNAHLQTSCTSPLYHLAQGSNYDWQYVADARGAAEYTASYALKPEQPDSKIMQDILQRMLRSRNENFTMAATLKDYLRYVGEAILSFTRVGTAQAVWFLLGLDFVSCSRKFISVNTLEKTKLFAAVISNLDELSSLPENSSAIRSPSFNSQHGLRRAYQSFCKQQLSKSYRRNDISFYAFLSNFKVQSQFKLSSKRIQNALTGVSIPKFKLLGDSVKIDRQNLCESIKNGFIIDECYYQLYNNDREPVIVYSPHFSIDYEDERCCKSILLMHLPWSKLGEDGLLIKSKNKLYKSAVDAVSHKRKIKKFPAYFIEHMQQEIHCRDCFHEVNEINGDTGDVMDDDAVSIDERMNDINNLHDIRGSDECGDLDIPITTSDGVMNLPNVYQTLNSHKRSYLKSFVENELRKEITKMELANQITGSQHCSVVSSDSYSVAQHSKYANHDELLQNVINQKNLFGDDQLRAFNKISECFSMNVSENADNHLVMFLSGEGGSGKTTLIKSLADNAKIIYGRLGGPYDPLLATAPTGSAANTIGGFTYHGILFASILRNGSISDTDAKRIAGKLKGTRVIVFDEVSLMSLEDIYGIDLKLRFARQATAAYTEDDKIRRYNLSKLMFGGWHVIFLGDFFQLPPVGGTRIYSTDTTNMKKQAVIGRELWTKINTYAELTQNFRCRNHPNDMLPPFLQSARVGKADKQLVEQINDQCYATHKDDMKCHPQALWISPTNAQVDLYNKQAFDRLVATGVATYRAVAIHSIADHSMKNKITSIKVIQNLFKATTTVVGKKVTRLASTDINFAIGQRVRVTQNLATQLGIFNGALGKIIGFHFDEDKEMHEEWMNPKNIAAYRLSQHKRQQNTPIIYVQLDKVKNDITCENQSGGANIIPFFMEANSFACINTDGCKYTRKQYPLEPCSATTTHKSQGITAEFGVVFHPGDPKTSNFAHSYVSVSRCQCCGVMKDYPDYNTLTILGPLSQLHFNRHQKSIEMVKAEYRRFESISDNNIFNIMYSE